MLDMEIVKQQLATMPMLNNLISEYIDKKPFDGIKIAMAHVLVANTLPMIIACLAGGAEIRITDTNPPKNDRVVFEFFEKYNITFDHDFKDAKEFDVALDCNAYFRDNPPKIGISEVTRSGIHKFNDIKLGYPVIDCDNSIVKILETFIGNPLSVEKAFGKYIGDPKKILEKKKVVIMGFGKIGRGLARVFGKYANIHILEISQSVVNRARQLGYNADLISSVENNDKYLEDTKLILTATGFPDVISNNFSKDIIMKIDYRINIGAVDEFGKEYSEDEVFMSKYIPFNFNMSPPTANEYIDGILVAQIRGLEILINNKLDNKVIKLPEELDQSLIDGFEHYNYSIRGIISEYFE